MDEEGDKEHTASESNEERIDNPQTPVRPKNPKHRVRWVIIGAFIFGAFSPLLQFFESPFHKFLYASACFACGCYFLRLELRACFKNAFMLLSSA